MPNLEVEVLTKFLFNEAHLWLMELRLGRMTTYTKYARTNLDTIAHAKANKVEVEIVAKN